MKRRAFLQSLLAGTAALTLPKSTRAAVRKTEDGDVDAVYYEFVLHREGVHCIGIQLKVPSRGLAIATIRVPEGAHVQVVGMGAHVREERWVTLNAPGWFVHPAHSIVFSEGSGQMESPVYTHERPLVLEAGSVTDEDAELVLALFFRGVPTAPPGGCPFPSREAS